MLVEEFILEDTFALREKILNLKDLENKSIHEIGELTVEKDDFIVAIAIAELEKQEKIKRTGIRMVSGGYKLALYSLLN